MRYWRFVTSPAALVGVSALAMVLVGCGRGRPPAGSATVASRKSAGKASAAPVERQRPVIERPTDDGPLQAADPLKEAKAHLEAGRLDEAQQSLDRLDAASSTAPSTAEADQARWQLELAIAEARRAAADKGREEALAAAQRALDENALEDALRHVRDVAALQPTPAQQERATALHDEIQRRRRARIDLERHIEALASTVRRDIEAAQAALLKDPVVALPLLANAAARTDQPAIAAGAIETLARIDPPQQALPLIVAVLTRDTQRDQWQLASRELVRARRPGAGPALLALALSSAPVEQRLAALEALSQVVDPPASTLADLSKLLAGDGPLLRLALTAAAHGARIHQQTDWTCAIEGRQWPPAEREQLDALPLRLAALGGSASPDVALAARALAVALHFERAQPLAAVKVQAASAEAAESPAAAALDGIWYAIDAKTMWRHPTDQPVSITLDLGSDRTVAAIKVWNVNEPGDSPRGWKELAVFTGSTPEELDGFGNDRQPTAQGIVPIAPGAANPPDYGTIVPLPVVRCRYLRLRPASYWQTGGSSGLAEIQVLGF